MPEISPDQSATEAEGLTTTTPETQLESELARFGHEGRSISESIWKFILLISLFEFISKGLHHLSQKKVLLSPKKEEEKNG